MDLKVEVSESPVDMRGSLGTCVDLWGHAWTFVFYITFTACRITNMGTGSSFFVLFSFITTTVLYHVSVPSTSFYADS